MTFMLLQELLQPPWVLRIPSSWYVQKGTCDRQVPIETNVSQQKSVPQFLPCWILPCCILCFLFWLVWFETHGFWTSHKVPTTLILLFHRSSAAPFIAAFYCRGCDKPCGGGQQTREKVCLGSDGLKYPSLLGGWLLDGWMVGWWMVGGEFFLIFFFYCPNLGGLEDCIRMRFCSILARPHRARRNILRLATSLRLQHPWVCPDPNKTGCRKFDSKWLDGFTKCTPKMTWMFHSRSD